VTGELDQLDARQAHRLVRDHRQPTGPLRGQHHLDLGRLHRGRRDRLPAQWPAPEVQLAAAGDEPGPREQLDVADVVVVEVREDDDVHGGGIDPEAAECLLRRTGGRTAPADADRRAEPGVDQDGPLVVAEDPEVVVHGHRPVGSPVGAVGGVERCAGGLQSAVSHRYDVVDTSRVRRLSSHLV
jgi:hypothetical protein